MTTSSVDHKFRIRTLNAISGAGLSRLPDDLYEVGGSVEEPDALLVRSAKLHDTPIEDSVLAVARAGAGTNNIPVDRLKMCIRDRLSSDVVLHGSPPLRPESVRSVTGGGSLSTMS